MVAGMSTAMNTSRTNAKNSGLYPPLEPYEAGMLSVSDVHDLYYELSGNPQATTVVFLHGGPGGSTRPDHRRFFDPRAYRILLFDQRGCGRSLPHASTEDNTTEALISDMEKLRVHVGAENWGVFGGSWGSTLGLAYIQKHPDRALFAVLRGIFLGRNSEIDWLYERAGAANLFPHEFDAYLNGLPKDKISSDSTDSILRSYHQLLTSESISLEERGKVAMAFCNWEGALSNFPGRHVLRRGLNPIASTGPEAAALAVGRLETHYFVNKCFFENDGQLLEAERMQEARKVPAAIVHGRWDMVCPVKSAYDLADAWPEASFHVIKGAGHSAFEDGTRQALVKITDSFRNQDGNASK